MIVSDGAHANSSRGAWQCIPTTFAAYHMAGTSNSIYDPVASAAASMNYVMNTYHVSPTGRGSKRSPSVEGWNRGLHRLLIHRRSHDATTGGARNELTR